MVLSWLPAKSLISSFKFVCKAWCTLIHDPALIKMHLNRVAINGGSRISKELYQFHHPINYQGLPIAPPTKLDIDFNLLLSGSTLVGSCNGLLCLSINRDESIILLNPSTRKYKISPEKLIEHPCHFKAHVPPNYGFGCYYNSISTIDEEFRNLPMPPCAVDNDGEYPYLNDYTILMNVRGWLGNVYFSRTEMMDIELEIWVMKEYGIGESWTKEFVIRTSNSDPPRELSGLSMFSRFMTCFLTGDQILTEVRVSAGQSPRMKENRYGRRVSYDLNKKKIDGDFVMVDMPFEHQRDDQVDYIETLVSLKSSLLPSRNN